MESQAKRDTVSHDGCGFDLLGDKQLLSDSIPLSSLSGFLAGRIWIVPDDWSS